MNIFIIIISLFFGVFVKPALAEEKFVTIETIPSDQEIIIGQTFPVNVVLETGIINTTFYYLFYGGLDGETSYIQTRGEDGPILSLTDDPYDWDNIPTFTTDLSGNGYLQSNFAYINPITPAGTYSLYVKLFLYDFSSDDRFISDPQSITVIPFSSITPAPTTIVTPTPTSVPPVATNTPIPTAIIVFPTVTPIPTTRNQVPTLTPTPTINMSIFGVTTESTSSATPTSVEPITLPTEASSSTFVEVGSNPPKIKLISSSKKSSSLPFVVFSAVSSFLIIFLIFLKIKKR